MATIPPGLRKPGRIPPFQPPDGGPQTGSPREVCDKTGTVGATGGNAPREAQTNAAGSGDEVSETVIVDGSQTEVCLSWHIEYF